MQQGCILGCGAVMFGIPMADGCGGYLVNINTDNPRALVEIESLLEADLTRNRVRPEPPPVAEMPAAVFSSVAGRYYPTSTRFALAKWQQGSLASVYIEADAEQLTVTRRGSRTVLYPVGPTLFRRAGDPVATVTLFSRHGRTYMQGELGNFERVTADAETHR